MAHTRSAAKRVRQNAARRATNKARRSTLRTQIKKANAVIASGNVESAQAQVLKLGKALDTAAGKGLIHKNEAARRKSRLAQKISSLRKA